MSRYVEVMAIVEGSTEETFINRILAPYLSHRNIGMRATQVSKPGEKGGDVKFSRVKNDIRLHLKQRHQRGLKAGCPGTGKSELAFLLRKGSE